MSKSRMHHIKEYYEMKLFKNKKKLGLSINSNENLTKISFDETSINEINLSKKKELKTTEKSTRYEFIFTDKLKNNCIKRFHNFFLTVKSKTINPSYEFRFHFNFEQMRILINVLKRQNLISFLRKLLIIDKENKKILLNYDNLNALCNDEWKYLEYYKPKKVDIVLGMLEQEKDDLELFVYFPSIETVKYIEKKSVEECFDSNFSDILKN